MKYLFTGLLLILFFTIESASAQSISIDSISGNRFCVGSPISVTFTASGNWRRGNAFTFQLSDTSGSFANSSFTYLGSIVDSAPGTFTIVSSIPITVPYSEHYRVRVIGAYPYVEANYNSNILVGAPPKYYEWGSQSGWIGAVALGVSHQISIDDLVNHGRGEVDSLFIDFGPDASLAPITYLGPVDVMSYQVSYSSVGLKTRTWRTVARGGCSASGSASVYVYDCATPQVPHDAIIVSSNGTYGATNKTYWVNPGISFIAGSSDTIFAEAGASITGRGGDQSNNIVYLKPGASSDADWDGVVLYAPGAGVDASNEASAPTLECPDLNFDYSVAPPNSVMHINEGSSAVAEVQVPHIRITPNPANGIVSITGLPQSATVNLYNVLGERVRELKATGSATLDIGELPLGTYYIRIASNRTTVTTTRLVKE